MGTNYYVETEACECCGNKPELFHIGKSSAGWTFSFHATDRLRSWMQWKEYLQDKIIVDECGANVELKEFIELVESKKIEKHNHTKYCRQHHTDTVGNFLDHEGNSFSEGNFS